MKTKDEVNDMSLEELIQQGIEGFFAHQTLANIREHLDDKNLTNDQIVNAIKCEFNDLADWVQRTLLKQTEDTLEDQFASGISEEQIDNCCLHKREAHAVNSAKALSDYMQQQYGKVVNG